MNILAKRAEELSKAKKEFAEGHLEEQVYKNISDQYYELYYKLRKREEKHLICKLTTKQRQKLHKYVLMVYNLLNNIEGLSYHVIYDKSSYTDRPIIYAPTHVGKHDIEIISGIIKSHYWLLSGDFEHLQGKFDSAFLRIVGVEYFNEYVSSDRASIPERIGKHLDDHDNAMWFIEGTWNMTPNKPILPPYWGIIDTAKKHNAVICPIGIDQYDKHFVIAIGEHFDALNYGDTKEEKIKAITDLGDILAGLKFDIWESRGIYKREELNLSEWGAYIKDRFSEWPGFSLEYIKPLIYRPKGVVESEDAYQFTKKMIASKYNAFLFDKRNKGNLKLSP